MIVGPDGRRLPPGEQGEILVQGPTVMAGYLNAPELNRIAFIDGWYRTGDVGSLDADGFLTLHGRKRETINRGSEKIAPIEIDHALMRHPDVVEAAAYGVPHPRLGEDVAAAVVLRPGARATPIELREFVSERLARFKNPAPHCHRQPVAEGAHRQGPTQTPERGFPEQLENVAGGWRPVND